MPAPLLRLFPVQKTAIILKRSPGKYLLFTVGADDIVYAHKIDASGNTVLAKNLPLTDEGYGQHMLLLEDYSGAGSKLVIIKQGKLQAITIDSEGQPGMTEVLATYSETRPSGPMSLSADGSKLAVALHQGTKQVYPESYQSVKVKVYGIADDRSTLSLRNTLTAGSNARITSLSYSPDSSNYLYYSLQTNTGTTNTHRVMPSNSEQEQLLAGTGMISRSKGGMLVGHGDALKLIANADAVSYTTTTLAGNTTASYKTTTGSNILKYNFDFVPKNGIFAWKVGKKVYELKDHLGNVRSLIVDYRAEHPTQTGVPIAALEHYAHYYPFGMQQPGRNGHKYRFGMSGHEKLDEIAGSGNYYDMGARLYDPRIGRTPTIDPFAAKYPNISPYAYALNNPIKIIDPDGRDVKVTGEAASGFVEMTAGFLKNVSITRNEETGLLSYSLTEGVEKEDLTEFEQTLIQSIDHDEVIDVVAINSSDKVFFDADVRDGGGNEVDMGDFSLLDGKLTKFQEALVGHFLQERLSDKNFSKAHGEGLDKETAILQEKYSDITSRSHTLERSKIEGMKTSNSDGTFSDYYKLLDYGSSSGEKSNALWIRYDYKKGETPNINSPSGVNTTNDVVKKQYGNDASVPSDIDE